jgi:hypothetical protein
MGTSGLQGNYASLFFLHGLRVFIAPKIFSYQLKVSNLERKWQNQHLQIEAIAP